MLRVILLLLPLLLIGLDGSSASDFATGPYLRSSSSRPNHPFDDGPYSALYRHLQDDPPPSNSSRPCDGLISIVSQDTILQTMQVYLSVLLQGNNALLESFLRILRSNLFYDVAVYKLCASCQDLDETTLTPLVCDDTTYGSDAQLSFLVMVPVSTTDPGTIVSGTLQGFMNYHGTRINVDHAPTISWPTLLQDDVNAALAAASNNNTPVVLKFVADRLLEFPMLVATAKGVVSIAPDYIGFGESQQTHNRTFVVAEAYQQSGYVGLKKTQQWLSEQTNSCTTLSNNLTMGGVSEGGYGVLAASILLQNYVTIHKVFASAPLLDPDRLIVNAVQAYDNGQVGFGRDNFGYQALVPFSAFAFSSNHPDLANTGTDQQALAPEWRNTSSGGNNVLDWFDTNGIPLTSLQIIGRMPLYAPTVLSAAFVTLVQQSNSSRPCTDTNSTLHDPVALLCQALVDQSLSADIATSPYPISICSSPNDTIIPYNQLDMIRDNPNIEFVGDPLGNVIQADHGVTSFACSYHNVWYFGMGGMDLVVPSTNASCTAVPTSAQPTTPTPIAPTVPSAPVPSAPVNPPAPTVPTATPPSSSPRTSSAVAYCGKGTWVASGLGLCVFATMMTSRLF